MALFTAGVCLIATLLEGVYVVFLIYTFKHSNIHGLYFNSSFGLDLVPKLEGTTPRG